MKHHNHKPVFFAVLLALGLALVFTGAVFAEDAPPPEQPAAPAPAAPALPEGSGEVGGEGNTPAPAVGDESTAPLAIMSGDLEILSGQAWYWLGATKTPFANAQAALDNILATGVLPSDRKLYLEDGKFAGFTLDGTAGSGILSQMNGVLGFDGNFTGYNNENASEVAGDGGIEIHHTVTGFTLQGLNISGGDVLFHHNAGTLTLKYIDVSGDGNRLEVTSHNGAINADTVSVNNGEGALLQNTGGVSANITVFNSVFNNNSNGSSDASGLVVHSTGLARLSGIEANGNQGDGLYVTGVTGIEVLNSNTANNGGNGVYALANTAAKVTVNTLQTHYNGDDGIHIETLGDISLLSIAASNNGQNNDGTGGSGFGIAVGTWPTTPGGRNLVGKDLAAWENHDTGIDLKVSGTTSLSGIFTSNNWGTGTWVASSGAITLNGVTSNNDRAAGIHLVNINAATPQPVKILNTYGTNEVSNAQGDYFGTGGLHGVIINTNGSVTINDLSAHDNAFGGIYIEVSNPAGTVTMTNSGAGNNQDFGVQVVAQNSITYKIGWAHNNAGIGMLLNNSGAPTPKPVTLETAGWFYNNQGEAGVKVVSKGIVTLKGINAGDNRGYGILVNNSSGSGSGVSVLGTSTSWLNIARNGEAGLYITSSGAVTLAYISAQENGRSDDPALDKMGIRVTNESPLTPKPVTLSNIDASRNNGSGVEVTAGGTITATNISASDNQLKGVLLRNTTSGGVKVLRTAYWHNDFSRNGEEGLRVEAHGPVTLARLNVYENGWQGQFDGTYIDNCLAGIDEACLGKWAVTLNITSGWNNDFSRNWGMGLYIASGGAVKLSNINISQNGTYGLLVDTNWLNANGAVTIASVGDNQNNFWNNGLDGAGISATGAITITNFQANDNGRHGLNLSNIGNWLPVFTPVPITLTNGQANNNHNGHGIRARSVGNIKLVDVEASNNDVHYTSIGFDTTVPEKLNDWLWDWDAGAWNEGDVYEFEVTDGPLPVELHVYLEFQGNLVWEMYNSGTDTWDALYSCTDVSECTLTDGNTPNGLYRARITGINQDNRGNYLISLNDSDTDYTSYNYIGASGLWLNNDYDRATGTVTVVNGPIRGTVNTHNNGSTGTWITSRKAITITGLHSNDNGGRGLHADNCLWDDVACRYTAPITINGLSGNFSNNQLDGMFIDSAAAVSIQNLDADNNHRGNGALIFAGNLTITTTNPSPWTTTFNSNGSEGLWIYATGKVVLNRLQVDNNWGGGAWIRNADALTPQAVSITNASFQDNYGGGKQVVGLNIETLGAVTLKVVRVNGNHGGGAYIDNRGTNTAPVTIQQSSFVNNNPEGGPYYPGDPDYSDLFDGIDILSDSNVIWNSSSAGNNNSGDGVVIQTPGTVTVLAAYGNNDFFNNQQTGLGIIDAAAVSITGMRGGGNGNRGLGIWTNTAGAITVANSLFENNGGQGLWIQNTGSGSIKLNKVGAFGNAAKTDSDDLAACWVQTNGGAVSILNSAFHSNGDWGILVELNGGLITPNFTGTSYRGNNQDGAGFDGTNNLDLEVVP